MRLILVGFQSFLLAFACAIAAASSPAVEEEDIDVGPQYLEVVEVKTRLGFGEPSLKGEQVASISVHTREDILASRARSLPEYLAGLPGVVAEDAVGNGRQLSIDLRGFTSAGGTGSVALLVDGVRVNDPDTGLASFATIRLQDIERIEIRKGPLGQLFGGGALSGAINVVRRRGAASPGTELRTRVGSHGLLGLDIHAAGPVGRGQLVASAGHDSGSGFRDGAAFEESSARVEYSRRLGRVSSALGLSLLDGRWRHPGVLTAAEFQEDPWQSGSNRLDFDETESRLLTLRLHGDAGRRTSWSAVAAHRGRENRLLTTGRDLFTADPRCFGFLTENSLDSLTLAVEGTTSALPDRPGAFELRWGLDLARDRLEPESFLTTDLCENSSLDELAQSSKHRIHKDSGAVFGGAVVQAGSQTFEFGFRWDGSTVGRRDLTADPGPSVEKDFGDLSWGVGVLRPFEKGTTQGEWRLSWATSFLAPSSLQLFAFEGFQDNEELEPQRGAGVTLGVELRGSRWDFGAELFGTDLEDEIVFDTASLQNRNESDTRRIGIEVHGRFRPHPGVGLSAGVVLTDATFRRDGPSRGDGVGAKKGAHVPLVPGTRVNLGVDLGPFKGIEGGVSYRHVGTSPLGNDTNASLPGHHSHDLLALRLSHLTVLPKGSLEVSLGVENLLDARYTVRALEDSRATFVTPGPPRTLTFGLGWVFP